MIVSLILTNKIFWIVPKSNKLFRILIDLVISYSILRHYLSFYDSNTINDLR